MNKKNIQLTKEEVKEALKRSTSRWTINVDRVAESLTKNLNRAIKEKSKAEKISKVKVAFERLKQKVKEVKREIKKKELPIEKVLRTLEAGVWKGEGAEEPYEGLPEAPHRGPLGKIVSTLLQVSDILADFMKATRTIFRYIF